MTIETLEQLLFSPFLKKIQYRSWHRGTKEMDIILGTFTDLYLPSLSLNDQKIYAEFLKENDADLWNWITGINNSFKEIYSSLIQQLRLHYKRIV